MGEEEIKPKKKWLEGYKDVEKRKAYMRAYQLQRYHEKMNGDFKRKKRKDDDIVQGEEDTMPGQKDDFQTALNSLQDVLGKEDPVAKAIDKYGKYIPLAFKFIEGFTESMRAHQMSAMQNNPNYQVSLQQANSQKVQPPPGWKEMSSMQRLDKKYDGTGEISQWYRAGEAYEAAKGAGGQVQISYSPVPMERTVHGQKTAKTGGVSMAELNRRAEQEQWDGAPAGVKEVPRKDGQPSTINEIAARKKAEQTGEEVAGVEKPEEVLAQVGQELAEDQKMYLNIVIEYFKNRKIEDFEKDVENVEETSSKFEKTFLPILPMQVRHLIKNMAFEELEQALKDSDNNKYELLKKKRMIPKLKKMWNGIQEKITA